MFKILLLNISSTKLIVILLIFEDTLTHLAKNVRDKRFL